MTFYRYDDVQLRETKRNSEWRLPSTLNLYWMSDRNIMAIKHILLIYVKKYILWLVSSKKISFMS